MAEFTDADRAFVTRHLEAISCGLILMGARLAGQGEPEPAGLIDDVVRELTAVCRQLGRPASAG